MSYIISAVVVVVVVVFSCIELEVSASPWRNTVLPGCGQDLGCHWKLLKRFAFLPAFGFRYALADTTVCKVRVTMTTTTTTPVDSPGRQASGLLARLTSCGLCAHRTPTDSTNSTNSTSREPRASLALELAKIEQHRQALAAGDQQQQQQRRRRVSLSGELKLAGLVSYQRGAAGAFARRAAKATRRAVCIH